MYIAISVLLYQFVAFHHIAVTLILHLIPIRMKYSPSQWRLDWQEFRDINKLGCFDLQILLSKYYYLIFSVMTNTIATLRLESVFELYAPLRCSRSLYRQNTTYCLKGFRVNGYCYILMNLTYCLRIDHIENLAVNARLLVTLYVEEVHIAVARHVYCQRVSSRCKTKYCE